MSNKLPRFLKAVDWSARVKEFCGMQANVERLEDGMARFAIWVGQIEILESGNPAVAFLREARIQTMFVPHLAALALYKPAASALRAFVESVLYYTYFRSHLVELTTLQRDKSYFILKSDIIAFHRKHTPKFSERETALALSAKLETWYSEISAIVHGQIPGKWVTTTDFTDIAHQGAVLDALLDEFARAVRIAEDLLLCTVAEDHWGSFESKAKRGFLKGLSGPVKTALGFTAM